MTFEEYLIAIGRRSPNPWDPWSISRFPRKCTPFRLVKHCGRVYQVLDRIKDKLLLQTLHGKQSRLVLAEEEVKE